MSCVIEDLKPPSVTDCPVKLRAVGSVVTFPPDPPLLDGQLPELLDELLPLDELPPELPLPLPLVDPLVDPPVLPPLVEPPVLPPELPPLPVDPLPLVDPLPELPPVLPPEVLPPPVDPPVLPPAHSTIDRP